MVLSAVLICIVSINAFLSRANLNEFESLQDSIRNSGDVLVAIEDLHVAVLNMDRVISNTVFSVQNIDTKLLEDNRTKLSMNIKALQAQKSEMAYQQGLIDRMLISLSTYVLDIDISLKKLKEAPIQNRNIFASHIFSESKHQEYDDIFSKLAQNEEKMRKENIGKLQFAIKESARNQWIFFGVSFLATLCILLLARYLVREQLNQRRQIELRNIELARAVEDRTKELSLYSQELARSNRELEDFAFVASHDLQEPLRKIRAFGERLHAHCHEVMDQRGNDYLNRMLNAAERMSKLISDLLEFSRVNTQGKPFEKVDLNKIVSDIKEDLVEAISEAHVNIEADVLPKLQADPMQMQQLFYNLLNNAVKFSSKSENPKVRIKVEEIDQPEEQAEFIFKNWVKISVIDNGIGFDQAYSDKIFAPFQRLHGKQQYQGTGIGLSICRRIVERHNGVIKAEAVEDEGAKFHVYLPLDNSELSLDSRENL